MATPKRIKREERDYADIYQENFVRNNDPAALGQAAFNRQLSSGIQRNMGQERLAENKAVPPVIPGLYGAGGQAQATGMQRAIIEQDALIAKERREDELRRGVSATQRAGYSPVDNAQMAMDRRAGAMARAQQPQAGLVDPNFNFRQRLADAANDPTINLDTVEYGMQPGFGAEAALTGGVVGESPYGRERYQYATGGTPVFGPQEPVDGGPFSDRELVTGQNYQAAFRQGEMPNLGSIFRDDYYDPRYGDIEGVGAQLERERKERERKRNEQARYDEMTRRRQAEFDAIKERERREARRKAAEARARQGDYLSGNTLPTLEEMTGIDANAQRAAREAQEAEQRAKIAEIESRRFGFVPDTTVDTITMPDGMVLPNRLVEADGIMPSELGTPVVPGDGNMTGAGLQTDYTGAGLQTDMQRAREEEAKIRAQEATEDAYQADLERGLLDPETYGLTTDTESVSESVPESVSAETDVDGNQITLGGASASYDAGIRDEEARLNEQLDAEENAVLANYNQRYNQFMQLAINRGAVRGNLEQQGFTGGIGQQVEDFLSTQEIVALDALMRERDDALQAIRLERVNIPNIAKTNYIQSLQLESATSEARLAFSQNLSQKVLDGSMSLEEANGIAQEYGLQDVQSVFQSAIEAQIAAGTMDKAGAKAELQRLGLDASFLDEINKKTYENWQLSDEASQLESRMMAVLDNQGDSDWGEKVAIVMGGIAAGSIFPGPGWIIGGLAGLYAAYEQDVNKSDMGKVSSSLMGSDLMMNEGAAIWNGDFSSLEIKRPAGQATSNAAQQEYLVTVDGTEYRMEGADILALAVALKEGSYSKEQYRALFNTAKTIFNTMPADPGGAFDWTTGGRYSTIKKIYEKAF